MEYINKVELQGQIGHARISLIDKTTHIQFFVATNFIDKKTNGITVVETTWHNCSYFTTSQEEIDQFQKGAIVHLTGRICTRKYTTVNGEEQNTTEIKVQKIDFIKNE